MNENQRRFVEALNRFIGEVEDMPRFKGQASVVTALKRIPNRSAFK